MKHLKTTQKSLRCNFTNLKTLCAKPIYISMFETHTLDFLSKLQEFSKVKTFLGCVLLALIAPIYIYIWYHVLSIEVEYHKKKG
jgi:hypothetical protein